MSRHDPAVVHFMYPSRGYRRSLWPVRAARVIGRNHRTLLGLHEYSAAHPLRKILIRRLCRLAWRVVVPTEAERRALEKFHPAVVPIPSNLIADPEAVPPPEPPKPLDGPAASIVFFGFVTRHKGIETLLEACAILGRRGRPVRLKLIGQTPEDLAEYAAELVARAPTQPQLLGELPEAHVLQELRRADLCVFPFNGGASGRNATLTTALQAGAAVVTTRGPDLPPGLSHGEHAWLVEPRRPVSLALDMERLLDDPELRAKLARQGQAWARGISWRDVAQRFIRLYAIDKISGR